MEISNKDWNNYITKLSKISTTAGRLMQEYVDKNGYSDRNSLIEYAHALVVKYGEGSAELACMMYDAVAEAEKANVLAAVPAETASIGETAKAINGSLKQSPSGQLLNSVVQRMVKQSGADTTLKNAIRDKAQFAWIPSGDTCAFCITLASRGWQYASKEALKGGHAEHIHSHCDCQYAIRFNKNTNVEGYDPEVYKEIYYSEDGKPEDKINAMRRKAYAENKEAINAQKREAYANRKNKEKYTDITESFLKKSKPGIGEVIPEKGTDPKDIATSNWLLNKFGGNITVLAEQPNIGQMPDAIWDGVYWEYKNPKTKRAFEERIRKAQHQLGDALERDNNINANRGMLIDITNSNIDRDESMKFIIQRTLERRKGPTTVIVKENDELLKVLDFK